GAAEVALGLAGRVQQRHEHLGTGALPGADDIADAGEATGVTVLVAEPLVDADGGVPLLGRRGAVGVEDVVDERDDRVEDGLGPRGRLTRPRLGLLDDFLDGPPVEAVLGAGLSHADLAGADAAADLGPELHVGEHSCLLLTLSGPREVPP